VLARTYRGRRRTKKDVYWNWRNQRARKERNEMNKIDTQVRHVTKPGANLFAELGFSPDDARRYQAESRERIDHTLALKEQLMGELVWVRTKLMHKRVYAASAKP
jgi:hypothetical protein